MALKENLLSFSLFLLFTPQTNRTIEINAGVGGGKERCTGNQCVSGKGISTGRWGRGASTP